MSLVDLGENAGAPGSPVEVDPGGGVGHARWGYDECIGGTQSRP